MLNKKLYDKNSNIFQNYIALTNQKPILVKKVIGEISSSFVLSKDREFTFMDIGCGDGVVTLPLIDILSKKSILKTICIEPSSDLLAEIKNKTSEAILFIQKDIESKIDLPKADFILMSHLFPYIRDIKRTLKKVTESLSQNGIGLIVVNNKDSDDSKLRDKITKEYSRLSERIQESLEGVGISFEVDVVESKTDASGVLEMNDNGKAIISFFKHKEFRNIPKKEISNLKEDITRMLDSDKKLTKKEDYIWI